VDGSIRKNTDLDSLRKRNIIVVDWCCMCKKSEESIDHLLFHCEGERFKELVFQFVWYCLGYA
jgi:hypothetical protein